MAKDEKFQGRPFISIMFNCCQVYQRIYKHKDGDRYEGRCPRCLRILKIPVQEGGSDQRSFVAE